mgnify:CR=1 FL=1
MQRQDVIIVGAGPAGLSAAINLKIRNKNILIFGNGGQSEKVTRTEKIKNYLGLPDISGAELQRAFDTHMEALGISVLPQHIDGIFPMGDYFAVLSGMDTYETRCVILATDVSTTRPISGELELLGRGVSHCATCDGFLYKDKTIVCICDTEKEEEEVRYLTEVAGKVILMPQYPCSLSGGNLEILQDKPLRLERIGERLLVQTKNTTVEADGIFVLHNDLSPDQLLPGLEKDNGFIRVDRGMKTNLAGCFACGDCVGTPYQYMKAAGEGIVAAHSATAYLAKTKYSIQEVPFKKM